MKSRARSLILAAGALALLVGVIAIPVGVLGRLDFFGWDPPPAGTVLAERLSPDGAFLATVAAADSIGHYVFTMRVARTGEVAATRGISAIVGYHAHIVRVEWISDGSRAIATIDHDFGENNVRVALQRPPGPTP